MNISKGRLGVLSRRVGIGAVAVTMVVAGASPASGSATSVQSRTGLISAVSAAAPMAAYPQAVGFDATMIQLVNNARVAAGLARLTEAKGLSQLSVWWSSQEESGATGYNLAHNPNAWTMVTSYGAANRTSWGENVAWSSSNGTTAAQIFTAYMNSPGHKANILGKGYHFIGMGTVTGPHGLFNTTEFTDAVQPGQAVSSPVALKVANGDFVRDTTTGAVYRVVGGAPVYVSSWVVFGGPKAVKSLTHEQISGMPRFPSNGAFVRTPGSGAVYRIAGGAPLYVASWGPFGGPKPFVDIDPSAVAHGGHAGLWTHLAMFPVNDTYIQGAGSAAIFRVINGHATGVTSWAKVGGPKPFTVVHPYDISRAGTGGYYVHLR